MSGSFSLTPSGSGGTYSRVYGDDLTGLAVGDTVQVSAGSYTAGTPCVFFNGVRLRKGLLNDYTESSPATGRITFLGVYATPGPTDIILIDYDR